MDVRQRTEEIERLTLAPWATFSDASRGRVRPEEQDPIRPVFQRDRDRIIHCKAFRRLKQKTQVFLSPEGDLYRTRLTHTLEVAQIARTIARALRLNEDLTEAISLAHDLGHTPFGHAGESALDKLCPEGFRHYMQSLRVVDKLEKDGRGLNLTWEVRDGILNHRTAGKPSTLEGQVVRLCDKIAYIHHDMDDAIRAGILSEDDIPITIRVVLGDTCRERLNTLIHDIVEQSRGTEYVRQSAEIAEGMRMLRELMFANVYRNPEAKKEEEKAKKMSQKLKKAQFDFEDYLESMNQMKKMGGLSSVLGMMPGLGGMGAKMPELDSEENEKKMARMEAMIQSMTVEERQNPDLLNPSRKHRIARGAGVDISEVNRMVKQFNESRKLMKRLPGLMGKGGKKGRFKLPF